MEHHDIEELVNNKLASILTNPAFKATMHAEVANQIAANALEYNRAIRPVQSQEILCMPRPYNGRGDIAVIINRHHHDPEHAMSMLVHYSNFDEASNTVNFSFSLYQENLADKSKTKFCSPESDLEKEIQRQLAAVFMKEMENKSALWTLVTIPYEHAVRFLPQLYKKQEPTPAFDPIPTPPAPVAPPAPPAKPVVTEPPVSGDKYDPPIGTKQNLQSGNSLDDMFPAML